MFKSKKEILEKLVPPYYRDIPKTQKFQADLLETLKKETWAEENTRLCDPTLWKQSRLAHLPTDIAQQIYQKIIPLAQPWYSSSQAASCLTTSQGFQDISRLLKEHQIPISQDFHWPRTLCEHTSCPKLNGIEVPFSFTGDDMGDGNVKVYIRLLEYPQKLFAIPFTKIERSEVKTFTDSAPNHYSEGEWSQEETLVKKTHFERCYYTFCETHLAEAKRYLHRFHLTKNRNSLGKRLIPLKHFEKAYGETTEETLSIKTELVPMSDPVLLFDPSWIPN